MLAREDIRTLEVILTAGCNLACSYCYQNAKQNKRMSWEVLQTSIDWLLSSRHADVKLLFIGGEPLVEFAQIERAVDYVTHRGRASQRVSFAVVTNGTLLNDRMLDFFAGHDVDVQLSFDGVRPAQALRGLRTFDTLDLLLARMRGAYREFLNTHLRVSLTLLPATVPHLADSIDYFLASGLQQIAIAPASTNHGIVDASLLDALTIQFDRIFTASLRRYETTGEIPLLLFKKDQPDSVHAPDGLSMCGVGRGETPAVDVDGKVVGCVTFAESYQVFPTELLRARLEPMRMGDLRAPDFAQRLAAYPEAAENAELFSDRALKHSSFGVCKDCEFLASCVICPTSIGHIPGNDDPHRIPDFLCAYNLVSQRYRRRFPVMPSAQQLLMSSAMLPSLAGELLAAVTTPRRRRRAKTRRAKTRRARPASQH